MIDRSVSANPEISHRNQPHSGIFRSFGQWTIRARIASTFAVVVILVGVQAAFSITTLRREKADAVLLRDKSMPALTTIAHLERDTSEQQLAVLRMILSKPGDDLTPFTTTIQKVRQQIDREFRDYESGIIRSDDRALYEAVVKCRAAYREAGDAVIALVSEGKHSDAAALNVQRLRPSYLAYHENLDKLVEFNVVDGQNVASQIQVGSTRAYWITVIASCLVLVVSTVLGTVIVVALTRTLKRVAQSLSDSSEQVAAASAQVSASSQSLAEGTSEQAASIEETSSSMEEMASMTKRNSDGAGRANVLARQARESADAGAQDMEMMKAAMEQIHSSSDDIAKIVKTIDEIAFQTNILALNAAVEAARAGTAGAGFAVVADEVRALAQRSAQAAKETSGKIEGAIHRTKEGVEISEKVAINLGLIVERVRQVDELVREVTTACSEQSDGIQQINTAVTQMDKVVQAATGNAEETAAAAEELSAQAVVMRESVQDLTRLVTGSGSVSPGGTTRPSDDSETQSSFPKSYATRRPAQSRPRISR